MVRRDHFGAALQTLRSWIRDGEAAPGAPLIVGDVAERLRISATPVREALSRLAGEGLVEDRRGRGYHVPRWDAGALAQTYRLHAAYVAAALSAAPSAVRLDPGRRSLARAPAVVGSAADDALRLREATEAVFAALLLGARNPILANRHRPAADRLALARRFEPRVLGDLWPELGGLIEALEAADWTAARQAADGYHARRVAAAPDLILAAEDDGYAVMPL